MFWLRPATKAPRGCPSPTGVGRRMERNRQKLVGRDKGSLTEQQTKGRVTTTIQIRRIHNINCTTEPLSPTATAARSRAASEFLLPSSPTAGTQHDGTWYGIPCSVWPGWVRPPSCVPSWLLVEINPVLSEPRTTWNYLNLLDILFNFCFIFYITLNY